MKEQDKDALKVTIVIILVIIFMAVVLGVLAKPNEPHFKITKEVCEEVEIFLHKYNVSVFRIAENEFREKYDVFNNSYIEIAELGESSWRYHWVGPYADSVGSYRERYELVSKYFLRTETTCEQVPVDEIEFSYAGCDCSNLIRDNKRTGDMLCKECGIGNGVWNGTDYVYVWLEKGEYALKWINKSPFCNL